MKNRLPIAEPEDEKLEVLRPRLLARENPDWGSETSTFGDENSGAR